MLWKPALTTQPLATATIRLSGPEAAEALGARIARCLAPGDAILLWGDLGAGKSTLARGLIRAATGDPSLDVPSPTFTIVQTYDAPGMTVWHFDLYRLDGPEDLQEIGMEEADDGVAVIEWPERLGDRLAADRLDIALEISPEGRIARISAWGPSWRDRFDDIAG